MQMYSLMDIETEEEREQEETIISDLGQLLHFIVKRDHQQIRNNKDLLSPFVNTPDYEGIIDQQQFLTPSQGFRPLSYAAKINAPEEVIRALLFIGADPEYTEEEPVIEQGCLDVLLRFFKKTEVLPQIPSALHQIRFLSQEASQGSEKEKYFVTLLSNLHQGRATIKTVSWLTKESPPVSASSSRHGSHEIIDDNDDTSLSLLPLNQGVISAFSNFASRRRGYKKLSLFDSDDEDGL